MLEHRIDQSKTIQMTMVVQELETSNAQVQELLRYAVGINVPNLYGSLSVRY